MSKMRTSTKPRSSCTGCWAGSSHCYGKYSTCKCRCKFECKRCGVNLSTYSGWLLQDSLCKPCKSLAKTDSIEDPAFREFIQSLFLSVETMILEMERLEDRVRELEDWRGS